MIEEQLTTGLAFEILGLAVQDSAVVCVFLILFSFVDISQHSSELGFYLTLVTLTHVSESAILNITFGILCIDYQA